MNNSKYLFLSLLFCLISAGISAQSMGVRAGLNYSTFLGPTEVGERLRITNGFHFGFNYGYNITNRLNIRGELVYTQIGSKMSYSGGSYYKIPLSATNIIYERGQADLYLEISNAYIAVPFTANFYLTPRIEVFGGIGANFLINPVARGTLRFESFDRPSDIVFRQNLDYRYYKDKAGAVAESSNATHPIIIVGDSRVTIPKFAAAYTHYTEKDGPAYRWFDATAIFGFNVFLNKGLYTGIRVNYGLTDVSRNQMDRSLRELNEDNSFIFRDDFDRNLNFDISLGFRF